MYRVKVIPLNEKTENSPLDKEAIVDIENGHISVYKEHEDKLVSSTKKIVSELTKMKNQKEFVDNHFSDEFNKNLDSVLEENFHIEYTPKDINTIDYRITHIEAKFNGFINDLNNCIKKNEEMQEILDNIVIELIQDKVLDISDIKNSNIYKNKYFDIMDIVRIKEQLILYLKRNFPNDLNVKTFSNFDEWLEYYQSNNIEGNRDKEIPILLKYYAYLKYLISITDAKIIEANSIANKVEIFGSTLASYTDYITYIRELKGDYEDLKSTYSSIISDVKLRLQDHSMVDADKKIPDDKFDGTDYIIL